MLLADEVWLVQVMPSGLVMTWLGDPSGATATKSPFPYVTDLQELFAAEAREVQLMPSGLVMTRLLEPAPATATNSPFPNVTDSQLLSAAELRAVQEMESARATCAETANSAASKAATARGIRPAGRRARDWTSSRSIRRV
jgi:hypothetical protein